MWIHRPRQWQEPFSTQWRRRAGARFLVLLVLGLVVTGGVIALTVWKSGQPETIPPEEPSVAKVDDPRLNFPTPYRNVHPDVRYVGDAVCAECHRVHAETYHEHPMGRSMAMVAEASPLEQYDAQANNPFEALGMLFTVERRGKRVLHKQTSRDSQGKVITEHSGEVQFAIGSGQQGRTYIVNWDGYLYESPISWYSQKRIWDLSPGYEHTYMGFERPITVGCLFCHANDANHVEHSVNRYQPPIFQQLSVGCERCHGPGELHVASRRRGDSPDGLDGTIVNPRRLEPALREAVCQQCHLRGEVRVIRLGRSLFDYRPGLPLHQVISIFVRPPERASADRSVSHVEQMHLSRCFQQSAGKLGCISCHDPHWKPGPEERVTHYRNACLYCHAEQACGLPEAERRQKSQQDSCVDCHMPATASQDIAHAAVTDHRILRHPDQPPEIPPMIQPGGIPLVHFHQDLLSPKERRDRRDLAVAMIDQARSLKEKEVRQMIGQRALPFLDEVVHRRPGDTIAWVTRAYALGTVGRTQEALAAVEVALEQAPRHEVALRDAAHYALELGQEDVAIGYYKRLLEVNPWEWASHYNLGVVLSRRGDWRQVLPHAQAALQLDPANVSARMLLVSCYVRGGDLETARSEFETLLALKPPNEEELRRWFAKQTR